MNRKLASTAVITVCVGLLCGGCLSTGEVSGNEPPVRTPVEPDNQEPPGWYDGSGAFHDEWQEQQRELRSQRGWTCAFEPTYDDDWHNDALCTNGLKSLRPYLRPTDSFITPQELMASARVWEQQQNS